MTLATMMLGIVATVVIRAAITAAAKRFRKRPREA
jgi:hypothetical protein